MFLVELTQPVSQVRGVGPAVNRSLGTLGIHTIKDLLTHFPRGYEDRLSPVALKEGKTGKPVNTLVRVIAHDYFGYGRKRTLKVWVEDETARGTLVCFGRNFLAQKLVIGEEFYLYGTFTYRHGELQSGTFDVEKPGDPSQSFGRILPLYPLTEGLSHKVMRKIISYALKMYGKNVEEELPSTLPGAKNFPEKGQALEWIHFPLTFQEMKAARDRFIFEELFFLQLMVGRRSFARKGSQRERRECHGRIMEKAVENLHFTLTKDQERSLAQIREDLAADRPMGRLLQGDVGSGKTLVAFLAATLVIEGGKQVAFMAPTELLARQHADNAAKMLEPLGIRTAFLSGNLQDKNRKPLLSALEEGEVDLLIGTHALFSRDVSFKNLGLSIVDEQHRFGVLQRLALMEKGKQPDLLLMTATPIPRTLTLTLFGDLDVSTIKTMPPGRLPVETHLTRHGNESKVYNWIREELDRGRQAYFVYPLIQRSEKSRLKDAEGMYHHLSETVFPDYRLGLIHSRLKEENKRKIMEAFVQGRIQLLVSTSVVEVGVDVANATCMVIEHAERFGLSALHQLRGRVGRGKQKSFAFLLYTEPMTDEARQRIMIMKDTSDGFKIAEKDLKIRGPGDLAGKQQSGFLRLQIADLIRDYPVLLKAREDAFSLVEKDPGLLSPDNRGLRHVLTCCPPFEESFLAGA